MRRRYNYSKSFQAPIALPPRRTPVIRANSPVYSSDLFSFKDLTFVAEASTLGHDGGGVDFKIKSAKTGQFRSFYRKLTGTDRENEVQYWKYGCVEDPNLNAVVFND